MSTFAQNSGKNKYEGKLKQRGANYVQKSKLDEIPFFFSSFCSTLLYSFQLLVDFGIQSF